MKSLSYPVLCLALLLGGCGKDAAVDAPVTVAVDVTSLPDPCTLLTEPLARELLGAEKLEQKNLENERARSRICSYKETKSDKMLFLSMMLFAPGTMSSATDSREDLVTKASRLAGGVEPIAILDDVGNIAFVFDQANATRLQVLTGIGGALNEGDAPAELQLGYAINLPGSTVAQRQSALTQIARDHFAALAGGL